MRVVDEVVAPDVVLHDPSRPTGEQHGREAIKQLVTTNRAAFPDLHFTIEDQVAEGDKVAIRLTMRGTQRGELQGIPRRGMALDLVPRERRRRS